MPVKTKIGKPEGYLARTAVFESIDNRMASGQPYETISYKEIEEDIFRKWGFIESYKTISSYKSTYKKYFPDYYSRHRRRPAYPQTLKNKSKMPALIIINAEESIDETLESIEQHFTFLKEHFQHRKMHLKRS